MAKENKLTKNSLNLIIQNIVVIAIGIAFCFSLFETVLSIVLGVSLIVAGVVLIVISIITTKVGFTVLGLLGGLAIAVGIVTLPGQLIALLFDLIPYLLIVFGGLVILDAFLRMLAAKKIGPAAFTFMLIAGSGVVALGICFLTIPDFKKYAGIALGVGLIIYGVVAILVEIIKANKKPAQPIENK